MVRAVPLRVARAGPAPPISGRPVKFIGIDEQDETGRRRSSSQRREPIPEPRRRAGQAARPVTLLPQAGVPSTLVLDRHGRIADRIIGPVTGRDHRLSQRCSRSHRRVSVVASVARAAVAARGARPGPSEQPKPDHRHEEREHPPLDGVDRVLQVELLGSRAPAAPGSGPAEAKAGRAPSARCARRSRRAMVAQVDAAAPRRWRGVSGCDCDVRRRAGRGTGCGR